MTLPWPVEVVPLNPVSCASTLWRMEGALHVTLVVKATFGLVPDGPARMIAPEEIVPRDRHYDKNPVNSVEAAGEVAPYLPRAGVVLVGHAYAPGGVRVPAVSARLSIFRERVLLDKTVHVFGDRAAANPGSPQPFQRMPLRYERAFGGLGIDENPVGTGALAGSALPNLIHPASPRRPAGFGPIGSSWPSRRSLLGAETRVQAKEKIPELGAGFAFGYFQSAPPDQTLDAIEGDEWILLDGLHPTLPRVRSRLPSARGMARAAIGSGPLQPVNLAADMLVISADRQICSVIWRGHLVVSEGEAALPWLRVYAGVEMPGRPLAWPAASAPAPSAPGVESEDSEGGATAMMSLAEFEAHAKKAATPFAQRERSAAEPPRAVSLAGTPWSPTAAPVAFVAAIADDSTHVPEAPALLAAPPSFAAPSPFEPEPEEAETTALISLADVEAHARKAVAPFAIAQPSSPSAPRASSLAGTPWGPSTPQITEPLDDEAAPLSNEPFTPPPRQSEQIPSTVSGPLHVVTIPWQVKPPQDSLTVIVKGTFLLVPGAPARALDEPDLPVGDLHLDDEPEKSLLYSSDFAIWKPRADVTLTGHAHAVGGSSPAMQVGFRFGDHRQGFDRVLYVFGERRWQKSVISLAPTEPLPFTTIPLVYERAFGGPRWEKNPVGTGYKAAAGPDGVARLPNVELPRELVKAPGDAPAPACFAPIPMLWKARWSKLGTYDKRWFKSRWPYFPEDFDWTFFQSAPEPQRVEWLVGDEPYEITGLFADRPSLSGALPGLRVRGFAQRTAAAGGGFEEILLRLDTVAFDADALKVNLVWRGVLEVSDEDAPEMQALFAMTEALSATPATLEEARLRWIASVIPREPVEESPDAPTSPANDAELRDPALEAALAEMNALEAMLAEREAKIHADLLGAEVPDAPASPPPSPDAAALAASLRAAGASEEDIAEVLEAIAEPLPAPEAVPQVVSPPSDLRARAIALLHEGASFDGEDFAGADLRDLDFSGRSFVEAVLKDANLRGASFASATLTGAQLGGAVVAEADFTKANLTEADLTEVDMSKARFDRAVLSLADFSGARGAGASFAGATGEKTIFTEADLTGAIFEGLAIAGADFSGATLGGASFRDAEIPEVRLYDARGAGVAFDRAKMPGARAEGAVLSRCSFKEVVAEGSVWERAILDESIFHQANFKASSFLRASCLKADFTGADLREGRLRRAQLTGAVLRKANLMNAVLDRADLTIADLRGANLHAAGLWKAKITDARLDGAILTQSTLVMRRPP